jgi:sensor c-di-GMP phosphodiesterase-like protein
MNSLESQELLVDMPSKLEKVSEDNHQEIASATISKIQVQNKHFSMHFFLLVALCLITTVMLFAIVIKVKQRYFS